MSMPFTDLLLPLILTSALDILEWIVTLPVEIFHAYSSLLRWAADSVQTLFDKYGYWVIFLGTLSENTLLVGLIVPGAVVVILAGLAAHDGSISAPLAIVIGIAGTIIGDTLSYFMGRYGWSKFGQSKFLADLNNKVREPLMRRGVAFVFFYHFAGYTRVIGPTSAGLLRMPYRTWAPADYTGAMLWICTYLGIGYGLGALGITLNSTDRYFRFVEWGLLIVACVWIYFLLRAHTELFATRPDDEAEGRRANEAEEPEESMTE